MNDLFQLIQVLRKGTKPQRIQVGIGLALVVGAAVYVLTQAFTLILVIVAFLVGLFLIRRASRRPGNGSPPSASA